MTYLVLIIPVFIISLLSFTFCFVLIKYIKIASKHKTLLLFIKKLSHVLSSARYGNLYTRLEEREGDVTYEIAKNLNSLFESILDRDVMIKEYVQKEKEDAILKEDFVATLTHDLKVPIIAQDNTYNLLLAEKFGPLTEVQKEALEKLKISNIDLKYLVEAVLETYKLEHKGIVVKKEDGILINSFITGVTEQVSSIFELHNKKICFQTELDNNFSAKIDAFLVKRVLNNLILNALSYSTNSDKVEIFVKEDGANFEINVRDYGIGIQKEEIDKIFKKYYSGNLNLIRSSTGLGLYLSNRIIKAHGGKIKVESEQGQGSTFTVILPVE